MRFHMVLRAGFVLLVRNFIEKIRKMSKLIKVGLAVVAMLGS